MPQYLPLPDGSTVTIRDGETPEQAYIRAQQMYPEAFKTEAPAAPKERSWSEAASDIGASGKAGIGSLLQFPGQMYGLATGDFSPTGLYGYGKELEERGQKEKSAALRGKEEASQARVKEAEKKGQLDAFLTSIGETIKDPALLSSFIAEQVPSQLPALLAGIGTPALSGEVAALRQAAKILGTKEAKDAAIAAAVKKGSAAAVSTGAVQQGADIGTGVYEDMYKKLITQGATPEKAADTSINYARAAGAGAAVISLLAQRLPGARTLEETFAGKRGATGAITGFGKGLLGESGSELTEETGGKFLQNLAMRQIDPTQSLTEGLGATAGQAVIGGGLLGGVAGAYSGMRGEGPAKTQKQTEIEQARADAEKQQEEEKVRLNSPEYAQEVLTQAKALQAQKDALKAQKLKLDNKSASEVDKAFNSDIEAQIKQIDKQLKPLAEEYVRVRPILKQAAEQARVAKLTPQEYAFGMEPEETAKKPAEPELYEQQIAKPPAPPKAEDIAAQHAAQSIQLANDQRLTAEKFDPKNTTPAVSEYVEYLMQNPILAKQVQQNRMKLPGLPAGLRNAEVLDALKLRLNFREKFEAPTPEAPESPQVQAFTSYMDDLKDKRNDVGDDMFFKYMVDPKLEKISEGKPPVIAVNAALMPFAQPKQVERVRSKINTLLDEVDQANTDRDAALRSNNRDAATAAFERGNQALEQLNAFAEPTPAGDLTKGRFPSAKTSPQASVYAKEVLRTRNEQDTALNTIEDKIDRLRRGDALGRERQRVLDKKTGEYREELLPYGQGASAASPAVLAQQAEEARGQYISAVLEEAAIHRRVAGKPALTYDEAIKAASRIHDVVGEWLSRAQAQPKRPELEEVIVQPAQMRANKLIRGAVTKSVLKTRDLATTPLNDIARLSDSEVKHFKAQIAKVVDSLSEMPSQVSRETPLLKQQFATTEAQKVAEARGETAKTAGGEMRRLREYVGNMIDKALTRNIPEGAVTETEDGPVRTQGIREALERVKEIIDDGKASKTLLDAAQNQAARILRGEDLGTQVYTKREVVPGKRVVENVPGREAETRFGERRTYKSVGYEAALAPEGSSLRELQDAIKLYESTAQEGEIAGEGAKGQGQLFPETRKDIGYIRATPANFAKSPEIKPVWEALDQARKLKAKTEANQKARSAKDKQGIEQIQALQKQIDAIKNNMKFFLTKSGDFNLGLYTNVDIAKMFMTYPEAGIKKEDKALMDQYLAVVRNIFNQNYNPSIKQTQESNSRLAKKIFDGLSAIYTPEQMEYVRDKLIPNFNEKIRPEYLIRLKEAQQAVALGQRLEGANNRLVEFMQDSNAAVRKQAEESRNLTDPLLDKIKLIKQGLRGSLLLTDGERAALDSEATLTAQRGAYKNAMAKAMGKARQRLSDTLGELLDPEIERARRALKAAKTRLATVESQIEAAKKEMTEGTGQAPNLINNLQKVQGLVENIETAETELADLQEARFGEIENDVVVTEAMLDKDLKSEREYLELLERQLADMRKEPLTAVEFGERGKLGKLKYPFSAQRVESQVKAQQAAVDEAKKRADEFQKDVQVWWPKVTAAFKKDGISVKDLPGAVFEKGRKVADIDTPEQKRLDDLRDNGMQAAKEVDEAAVLQRVKDKQIQIFDDEIFNARGEVQAFMGPEDTNQLADIMADPKTTNVKRVQATLKLGAMQKLASLEAQKEVFLTGKPTPTPKAATVPSTSALAAAKPFRTGSGVAKAFTPAEMDEMDRAELRDANALAKQILGTKAPQLKSIAPAKAARNAKNLLDTDAFVSDLDIRSDIASTGKTQADFEFSRGTPVKGLTKAELEAELTAGMGEPVTGRKIEKQIADKLAVYENLDEYLSKFKEVTQNDLRNKIPADAKGFVQNGKAVLFANNIGKGHGLGVLLHEVGVHMGFRNFFNEGQYNALVKTVKNWANKTEDSMEARVGKAAVRRVEAANTPPHQIDDELLAYAVEEAMQMGVEPVGVKGGNAVKNWLNMVVDAFKKALEKFGITSKNLTAGDLVNFAYGAAHLELKGTWHGTGVMFKMFNHAYMNTGSKAQTYGWGTYRAQRHGTAETYRVDAVTKTGGLYDQWVDRPDIQAWLQTQKPKFTGKLPAGIPEQFLNMPLREANKAYGGENPHKIFKEAVQGEIENIEEDRKQFSNLSNMPRAAQATPVKNYGYGPVTATPARTVARPIVVNTKLKTPIAKPLSWRVEWMQGLSDAEVDKKIQELKKFAETADEHLKVPFVNAVYKGKQFHELWDTNRAAAYTVNVFENTIRENNGTPPTWKEAIAATKVEAKNDLKDFEGSEHPATKDAYNTARKVLDTIDALDVNDFQYNPPSGPPVPEPAGYMMRTLHTRPENEYVLYDSHADKQPEVVKDAFKRIYDGLDKKQQEVFNRAIGHVRPDRQNGRDLYDALSSVLEYSGMPSEMCDMFASEMLHAEGVAGIKFFDGVSRYSATQGSVPGTFNYVDFGDKDEGAQIIATDINPINQTQPMQKGEMLFSRSAEYTNPELAKHSSFVNKIVSKDKSLYEKAKANATGLYFETMVVDRFAGFERLAKYMDPLKGTQMLFYLREYDQRMNGVAQAISNGAPAIVEIVRKADGKIERVIESQDGASIHNVVQILKDAQPMVGNAEAVNTMFTTYMAAIRAKNKGLASLNFSEDVTQELLDKTMTAIKATPGLEDVFKRARGEHNAYNRNLINFVVSTGALSKDVAKRLLAENDYIPFYRERNGMVELLIGNESPIRIASIAEQPYLHELIGGDRPILDFFTSSVQNTNMLMDMGLRNLATKNAVYELVDLHAAKFVKIADGPNVVKFREDGVDRYAVLATEKVKIGNKEFDTGVPADLLVKGMAGIPTQMSALFRAMAVPSQLLRKAITLSPLYNAKNLFRDSLAAPIYSGADFMPVIGALRELKDSTTKKTLEKRFITGGQQFTGSAADLTKILRDVSEGKPGWMVALGKLEAMSMEADAATRRALYNSFIEQGRSEMEATLLTLESMNFNKRGASPSVHWLNSMIPFFNAQIQGLNVLYKAAMGKALFNDQLRIREKLVQRGSMLAVVSLVYAAMMQDDDAYKNATPDQKYGNFFIRVPGLDEPIKLPVPFELGYFFKALPEAIYNSMVNEHGGEEAVKAFKQILLQTVPGGSSYGIPQILKPAIEAGLGKSFYTGRDTLSAREKELLPEEQFRANTSELAKSVGKTLGISPVVFEQLINGYTGTMGLAFMHAVSVGIPSNETPEQAVKRLSDYPIVGGAFQPNDAGGIINSVYERMNENIKVKQSFNKMVEEGRMSEAKDLLQRRGNEYMQAELAHSFKNDMTKLTQAERAIAASKMAPEEKRAQLDKIRKIKIAVAETVRQVSDKTIHLSNPF